jgi:hypothetical protein
MNTKPIAALAALFFILAVGSGTAYAAPPNDPCSLLTPAQVSGALGVAASAPKQIDQFNCEWSEPGANVMRGKGVLLHIVGQVGTLTPVERFNNIKMPLPVKGVTKTPLSGVGDDAVYGSVGGLAPELTVKKGNFVFQIRIHGLPRNQINEIEAKEKALAQDVLAKL